MTVGAFGSKADFGSTSLPNFTLSRENSKLFRFEVGSTSSGSSCSSSTTGSGSSSLLTFGIEPKNYRWDSSPCKKNKETKMDISSGESSRNSNAKGSNSRLDWDGMVESVYREEIGKMADTFQRGGCFFRT